jgi:hypothetical protein
MRIAEKINLNKKLEYILNTMLSNEKTRCVIFKGPVPLSFIFRTEKQDENGNHVMEKNGLLFLKIGEETGPRWVIHS